jgi:farnesyl-diphosphate farnesyltransferase
MNQKEKELLALLKGVSRSFYLSLRLLPAPMRRGAAVGYLLARASDTLADTEGVAVELRLECLSVFGDVLGGGMGEMSTCAMYQNAVENPDERALLRQVPDVLRVWADLPEGERGLVREVLETILGGQRLDLIRFASASGDNPVALKSRGELDDYTYRVAGCVGEFWTKLGFLTLGESFSPTAQGTLCEWGRDYGKGLQLVNILRDAPADLEAGRCYLPVEDARDRSAFLTEHRHWQQVAREWVGDGMEYARELGSRRLRVASGLPATLALETLDLLAVADWDEIAARVKVPRRRVYAALLRGVVMG